MRKPLMDDNNYKSLGTLLFGSDHTLPVDMIDRVREAAEIRENREYLKAEMPHVKWPVIWKDIEKRLPEIFDIDLQDIIAGALKKCRELKKYCDLEKYPASKPVSVPLGEHTFSSTHKPQLDIVVDGVYTGSIKFLIKLQLHLRVLKVELRGGVIHGLETGRASLKVSARIGKVPLLEKRISEFNLPGHLKLERGIPLPWTEYASSGEPQSSIATTDPAVYNKPFKTLNNNDDDGSREVVVVRRYYVLPSLALLVGFALLVFVFNEELVHRNFLNPPIIQPQYALTVVTEPPGAMVRLPDLGTSYEEGMRLSPGRYDIIVTHPGYEPWHEIIHLKDRDIWHRISLIKNLHLEPVPTIINSEPEIRLSPEPFPETNVGTYAMHFTSNPPGAYIEIKGIGKYIPGMRLKPGRYRVLLRKDGYQTTYFWIRVNERDIEKNFELQSSEW